MAEDASENTKKKFRDMCEFYECPLFFTAIKILWGMQWERVPGIPGNTGRRICKRNYKSIKQSVYDCIRRYFDMAKVRVYELSKRAGSRRIRRSWNSSEKEKCRSQDII